MALINKLNAIGDAIRNKTGKSDLLTLDQMPVEIAAIETGGGGSGGDIPEEAFVFSGDCEGTFSNNKWKWFIEMYGDKITTEGIISTSSMFKGSNELEEVPFDFNFDNSTYRVVSAMFQNCLKLKKIGKIKNAYPSSLANIFENCYQLRELPEFENLNLDRIHGYKSASIGSMFNNCYSLRRIPEELLKEIYNPLATTGTYLIFGYGFSGCYVLDEVISLNPQTGAITSNTFSNGFRNCHRLKEIIFATQEDGTPYSVNWKNQTIDLSASNQVGYGGVTFFGEVSRENISVACDVLMYNSGITADKIVFDAETYEALKNDPDWTAASSGYSRYNHDSAVNTINSLPSTSNTGCTIKFYGYSGTNTDGGAISNLTEEEIAVAAAKGWTVTIA